MRRNQIFLDEKVTYVFRLILICFSHFFLLIFLSFAGMINLLLGLLPVQTFMTKASLMGNYYHGVGKYSGKKFCCEFLTQISEHFPWVNSRPSHPPLNPLTVEP